MEQPLECSVRIGESSGWGVFHASVTGVNWGCSFAEWNGEISKGPYSLNLTFAVDENKETFQNMCKWAAAIQQANRDFIIVRNSKEFNLTRRVFVQVPFENEGSDSKINCIDMSLQSAIITQWSCTSENGQTIFNATLQGFIASWDVSSKDSSSWSHQSHFSIDDEATDSDTVLQFFESDIFENQKIKTESLTFGASFEVETYQKYDSLTETNSYSLLRTSAIHYSDVSIEVDLPRFRNWEFLSESLEDRFSHIGEVAVDFPQLTDENHSLRLLAMRVKSVRFPTHSGELGRADVGFSFLGIEVENTELFLDQFFEKNTSERELLYKKSDHALEVEDFFGAGMKSLEVSGSSIVELSPYFYTESSEELNSELCERTYTLWAPCLEDENSSHMASLSKVECFFEQLVASPDYLLNSLEGENVSVRDFEKGEPIPRASSDRRSNAFVMIPGLNSVNQVGIVSEVNVDSDRDGFFVSLRFCSLNPLIKDLNSQ